MQLFYIMGGARTGKDTLRRIFEKHFKVGQISVVDRVKEIAKESFDWNGEKDEKGRQLLSDLKDAWERYNDGPIKNVEIWLNKPENVNLDFVFIQVREYDTIKKMQKLFGGLVIKVTRGEEHSNVEIIKLNDFPKNWIPDYEFKNDGTLEEYIKMVEEFVEYCRKTFVEKSYDEDESSIVNNPCLKTGVSTGYDGV